MAPGGKKKISLEKLPVGYRLNPTDEDLVNHHLIRKLRGEPEEYCLIPELNIYDHSPWDLFKKFNELSDLGSDGRECFFFHRLIISKSKKINRKTKGGYWDGTGQGRKPQETDLIKWSKKYLVYHTGNQKDGSKTDLAMHEYSIISDQRFVLCRIHKIKPKKRKAKVGSCSSKADSISNPITADFSGNSTEAPDISSEASAGITMEPHNLPLASDINQPMYSTLVPQQKQIAAEEGSLPSLDTYNNSLHLKDLQDPIYSPTLTREQSPFWGNTFVGGCDEECNSFGFPGDTPDGGVEQFIYHQVPTDQSSNDVSMGFVYPPQQSQMMPTEEIQPCIDKSFNASCQTHCPSDPCGQGAPMPALPMYYGQHVTYLKEAPHSTEAEQITISPPNSSLLSPEQWQEFLQEFNTQPSSGCSEGGGPDAVNFGQSSPSNVEVPQVFDDPDIEALLSSVFDNSPLLEDVLGVNGTITGGYSTGYLQVPFSSGTTYQMETSNQ